MKKTGCRYQQHQLESGKTLLVLLAIETAVAWRMLLLRCLAHNASDTPAEKVLSSTQLSLLLGLIQQKKRQIPDRITISYILYEIAALGGYIKNNDPPGWLVLRRGFDQLYSMEKGWELAQAVKTITQKM
ncbi:MAG: hypothetical protein D3924_17190 [Candidatus Electrothrix sp. AR4]|nr:hypothetical protein [Candidatus Electrothrix sp. AR4]